MSKSIEGGNFTGLADRSGVAGKATTYANGDYRSANGSIAMQRLEPG